MMMMTSVSRGKDSCFLDWLSYILDERSLFLGALNF